MSLSLYQATVPAYLQILPVIASLLDKAEAHCDDNGVAPETIIQARLAPDMLPFAFQITSVAHHSFGAIEGVKRGAFSPERSVSDDFAGLKARIARAREGIEALAEDEVNSLVGKPVRFTTGNYQVDFTAENFLLSFSQANFYFHATTTYDILRWKGLNVGKRDFLGRLRSL